MALSRLAVRTGAVFFFAGSGFLLPLAAVDLREEEVFKAGHLFQWVEGAVVIRGTCKPVII